MGQCRVECVCLMGMVRRRTKKNRSPITRDFSSLFSLPLSLSLSLSHTKIVRHPSRVSPKSTKSLLFFSSWLSGHGLGMFPLNWVSIHCPLIKCAQGRPARDETSNETDPSCYSPGICSSSLLLIPESKKGRTREKQDDKFHWGHHKHFLL
ncbi:hypothetical protein BKA57DRAFT_477358 [Linnemannia elongata]|nr:hypothetical protein BKA57DRAFT_477358 [Linnemannia elongata]